MNESEQLNRNSESLDERSLCSLNIPNLIPSYSIFSNEIEERIDSCEILNREGWSQHSEESDFWDSSIDTEEEEFAYKRKLHIDIKLNEKFYHLHMNRLLTYPEAEQVFYRLNSVRKGSKYY